MSNYHKYQSDMTVRVYDVRSELYDLRNVLIRSNNDHLAYITKKDGHGHDEFSCSLCRDHASQIRGIERAIRCFGGRPR